MEYSFKVNKQDATGMIELRRALWLVFVHFLRVDLNLGIFRPLKTMDKHFAFWTGKQFWTLFCTFCKERRSLNRRARDCGQMFLALSISQPRNE